MKKSYSKPTLDKRAILPSVTAQEVSNVPTPPAE